MSFTDAELHSVSLSEATCVDKLDSHTYRVNLNRAFSIGPVPNGGYVGSCLARAGSAHLSPHGQPDLLTVHFEYLAQTVTGPAIIVVDEVKLSRRFSTLHLTLWQGGLLPHAPWITPSVSRRAILAYATFTNMSTLSGFTQLTGYETSPAAALPVLPDFERLKTENADSYWQVSKNPKGSEPWHSIRQWKFYVPRAGPSATGILDMWMRMGSGEKITSGALPYVVDSFPFNLHNFVTALPTSREEQVRRDAERTSMIYPTLALDLVMKMALPSEGVEWLTMRTTTKQLKNGMFDLDISVRTVDGALVALSHHVATVVVIKKNVGKAGGSSSRTKL